MRRAIGLMSGTSLDGVDAALIETDGEWGVSVGPWLTIPYEREFQDRLRAAVMAQGVVTDLADIACELVELHAGAVQRLLTQAALSPKDVAVVGFHGHTVDHAPAQRRTHQIGDGQALAGRIGIAVVGRFRTADVTAGGQGAPLVPLYHQALAADIEKPLLDRLLEHPYFAAPVPKSLDRNAFDAGPVAGLSLADAAATLAAFTAAAVGRACAWFPAAPRRWLVTGGGRHNRAVMDALARILQTSVEPVEAVGWQGDALEAQAFGYLAVRSLRGLPITLPTTTGVSSPLTGGTLYRL